MLEDHGKNCLLINGAQNAKLEKGFIEFKNYSRQIPVPFNIYGDFECLILQLIMIVLAIFLNIKNVPCSFAYKLVCIDVKFSKDVVLYRGENAAYKFIQCIFKEYSYCRRVMKNHFNQNLVMTAEQNEEFEKE